MRNMRAHAHAHAHAHTHTQHARTHARTHAHARTHTRTRTHARTHAHTHTHEVLMCCIAHLQTHPWATHSSGALLPLLHFFCHFIMSHGSQGVGAAAATNARDRLLIQVRASRARRLKCAHVGALRSCQDNVLNTGAGLL